MIRIPGPIPINIHPVFWLLCIGIGYIATYDILGSFIWAVVIFVSVLIHEFGHALTGKAFGQRTQIDLVGFGGLTTRSGRGVKLWQEFIIVFCGPLAGFFLALISYSAYKVFEDSDLQVLKYMFYVALEINIFWTIVNLIPVQPLDGGQLLRIILESMFGVGGIKATFLFSMVLCSVMALFFFLQSWILIGAVLFFFAYESYRQWKGVSELSHHDNDRKLQSRLGHAEFLMSNGKLEEAKVELESVRKSTESGVLHRLSTIYLAQILVKEERFEEAYKILLPLKSKLDDESLSLLQQLAYKTNDIEVAAELSDQTYRINPGYQTALLNGLVFALKGEVEPTVGWLRRAISDGLPNPAEVLEREEFKKFIENPLFISLKD